MQSTRSRWKSNSISLWELNPGNAERGRPAARGSLRSQPGSARTPESGISHLPLRFPFARSSSRRQATPWRGERIRLRLRREVETPGCRANHANKEPNWADSRRENEAAIENYIEEHKNHAQNRDPRIAVKPLRKRRHRPSTFAITMKGATPVRWYVPKRLKNQEKGVFQRFYCRGLPDLQSGDAFLPSTVRFSKNKLSGSSTYAPNGGIRTNPARS